MTIWRDRLADDKCARVLEVAPTLHYTQSRAAAASTFVYSAYAVRTRKMNKNRGLLSRDTSRKAPVSSVWPVGTSLLGKICPSILATFTGLRGLKIAPSDANAAK